MLNRRRCIHLMIGWSESTEDQHQVQSEDALKHVLVDADAWKYRQAKAFKFCRRFHLHLLVKRSDWKRARCTLPSFVAQSNPQPRQPCCCTTAGIWWCHRQKRRVWLLYWHRQLHLLCMNSQKVQIIKCTLGGFEGYPCAPTATNAPCCRCKKYNTNICFLVGSSCRYEANTLDIHFRLVTDLCTDHIKPSSCGYNVKWIKTHMIETQHLPWTTVMSSRHRHCLFWC